MYLFERVTKSRLSLEAEMIIFQALSQGRTGMVPMRLIMMMETTRVEWLPS